MKKKPATKSTAKKSSKKGPAAAPETITATPAAIEQVDVDGGSATTEDAEREPATAVEPASEMATAPTTDAIDMTLARARTLHPTAQRAFFETFDKGELHQLVERATGTKAGARLSPPRAVDKLVEALAPTAAPAAAVEPEQQSEAASSDTFEGEGEPRQDDESGEQDDAGGGDDEQRGAEPAATEELVLPPVGTVVVKSDRHGKERVRCVVAEGGQIEYAGKMYTSLTGAAMVAQRDLGLTSKTVNGWLFWGLKSPARTRPASTGRDPLTGLNKAWTNYLERAKASLDPADAATRAKLNEAVARHVAELVSLVSPPAAPTA